MHCCRKKRKILTFLCFTRMIPLGFSQLKKLKWLDLKDNPLDQSYKKHVGDCLDDQQCRQCAKSVVAVMKQTIAKREQQRLKKLEQQRSTWRKFIEKFVHRLIRFRLSSNAFFFHHPSAKLIIFCAEAKLRKEEQEMAELKKKEKNQERKKRKQVFSFTI